MKFKKFWFLSYFLLSQNLSFAADVGQIPEDFERDLLSRVNSVIKNLNSEEHLLLQKTLTQHPIIIGYSRTGMHIPTPKNVVLSKDYIEKKYVELAKQGQDRETIMNHFIKSLVPSALHETRHIYDFEKFGCIDGFRESELMGYLTEFSTIDALSAQFPDKYRIEISSKDSWYLKWKSCGVTCLKSALQEPGQYYANAPSVFDQEAFKNDLLSTVKSGKDDKTRIKKILKDLCANKNQEECNKIIVEKKPDGYRNLQEMNIWLENANGLVSCPIEGSRLDKMIKKMQDFYKSEEEKYSKKLNNGTKVIKASTAQ